MIIVDSGYWLGLLDRKDHYHPVCRDFLATCDEALISTAPVLTEAVHLLVRRSGVDVALRLLTLLSTLQAQGDFLLFALDGAHLPRMAQLMQQYSGLPMDFADASLLILAEHLNHGRIVSTDQRDFHAYRWKSRHPFQNLLVDMRR